MFDDEISHVRKIEDEVVMKESKTLILSSMLNDEPNSYCNYAYASNHAKYSILMLKDKFYIKDQWAQQFGDEVDACEDQGNHWEKKIFLSLHL